MMESDFGDSVNLGPTAMVTGLSDFTGVLETRRLRDDGITIRKDEFS